VRSHSKRDILRALVALLVIPAAIGLAALPARAAGFTAGNLVVVRVGTGVTALSNAATQVFLDEYSPSGSLVQSVPMPATVSGEQRRLTMSGSATSEGALSLSMDGHYVTLAGYDADPGTASVAGTPTSTVARVVARVGGDGTVDSSTAITDTFSGNNIRGAVSDDGGRFWATGANGGVRLATLGSSGATTQINSVAPTNLRTIGIAGGQLYVSTGSGTTGLYAVGSGLPTTGGQTPVLVTAAPSPYAFVALDRSPAVPGIDTLYIADDSGSPNGGVLKFSFDGTTWTARGSIRPNGSGARGVTGTVTGSSATLFATTSATAGQLVSLEDTAAFDETITATATTLATAAANTALRGVAFAPSTTTTAPTITTQPQDTTVPTGGTATLSVAASGTGPLTYQWYAGTSGDTGNPIAGATSPTYTTPPLAATISLWVRVSGPGGHADSNTATVTVSSTPNTAPTITPSPVQALALTAGDPDNPPALRTVDIDDAETPVSGLTVTVTTSNAAVATGGTTGTGGTRTLTVDPVGTGRATLTVTVSDGDLTASTTFPVAVSGALPAGTHNHYGASDASTAIDLGDGTMLVADDETNVLRVYDRAHSRYPAQEIDLSGLPLRDGTREMDIEASARTGSTLFWVASHGQNSSGNTRLNRQELFTTNASGVIGGSYQHLRDDLIAWDQSNGDALGLAAAATRAPEATPSGFNIEGAEFLSDGSTLLLGFRGPLAADGKAIVVPVTNASALVAGNPTTGVTASFGTALLWDLGGRGVREIRQIGGEYVIIAGPTSDSGDFKFYTWDGNAANQPLPRAGSLDSVAAVGKPESILPTTTAGSVQVLTDSGDTVFYGDGVIAKDLPTVLRKSTSATVTIGAPPACTGAVVSIGSVQGTTDVSPRAGQTVSIRGTIVGDYEGASPALRGFYIQDGGDGNASTSDGIFVFDNSANLVSLGDVVQVTGPASEFQGQTQLTASAGGVESCGRQGSVTATDVTLPVAAADTLERYEGMLVRFHQTLSVTEHFQLGRFGQVVVSSGGRLRQPTADIRATDQPAVQAAQAANNLNRLIIDDALQNQNPDPIIFGRGGQPLSASNTLRGGDTVTNPIGVMTYTWAGNAASGNAYRLRPINALGGTAVFDEANPRPDAPPTVVTAGTGIKVASANLLNFFNTFTGCRFGTIGGPADCRGASDNTEYQRQLPKEVASLRFMGADVIGYMEMENDGYGPDSAVQALVNALNAPTADGPGAWAFINPDAATGIVDSAGTDAIKAGIIYRTASVHPVAGKTFADQNPLFERRPVAQTFENNAGARFTVIANHFKSKGSCPASGPDTDQGDGQSCWNPHRTAQANELAQWIQATVVPGAGDPDVAIVGDLNSYAGEDPIAALEAHGYTNLIKAIHGNDAYSYVFDGQWGYLDYVMTSASLTPQVTGAGDAHHNADEPSVLDYLTDFKSPGQIVSLYAPDRFRTSDHDPVLAAFDLGLPATISGTPPAGVVGEPYSFTFTTGGTGQATVTLDSGVMPPGLTLAPDGALTGSPTAAGDFNFTARATNLYGSGTVAASISVGKGASATTLTVAPNPVVTGNPVTLTATVSAPVAATGVVTFLDGTTVLGTGSPLTVTLPAGSHSITARFEGDVNLRPSTSEATILAVIDPVVLDGPLPDGTVGTPYSATVPFTGGQPVTFTLTGGTLPPGLALSSNGTVSGTPTTAGGFAFTITATNPVSRASQAYAVTIAKAATTTTVTSSANPSIVDGVVRFTATVTGPFTPTGQVQFTVDGQPLGGPVALSGGVAVSSPISTLTPGAHQVTARYLGGTSHLASEGSLTQAVRYGIRVVSPAANAQIKAGSLIPIAFQLVDAAGNPIPLGESLLLALSGRLTVSAGGAQSLPPTRVLFDPFSRTFFVPWFTVPRLLGGRTGAVTITISVAYRDLPTQQATIPITLT